MNSLEFKHDVVLLSDLSYVLCCRIVDHYYCCMPMQYSYAIMLCVPYLILPRYTDVNPDPSTYCKWHCILSLHESNREWKANMYKSLGKEIL